mgnify:CR=1 FL=1
MNVSLEQIINATWITVYISVFSFILGTLIAFFLGFTLYFTRKDGIYENKKLYVILDIIINFIRSLPFVVLLLLLIPVTRLLVGSAIGPNAVIVSLTFFAAPYPPKSRSADHPEWQLPSPGLQLAECAVQPPAYFAQ